MEGDTSIVSKARTAIHSAAAKAEKVLTDIKSDFTNSADHRDLDEELVKISSNQQPDGQSPGEPELKGLSDAKQFGWRPPYVGTKQDWKERIKYIGRGRKGTEDIEKVENLEMSFPIIDGNIGIYNEKVAREERESARDPSADYGDVISKDIIPPAAVLRQLAIAFESGRNFKSIKDLLSSSRSSSPVRERASLSLSAVKSLMLREKEHKFPSQFGDDEILSFIQSVLDAEGLTLSRKLCTSLVRRHCRSSFPRDIHGAPPETFVATLSEVMGSFKTVRKMATFWCRVVAELRTLWLEEQYLPGVPVDEIPDLNSCLLYQQMQVMNCCVSRKKRRAIATKSLESILQKADGSCSPIETKHSSSVLYARIDTGELVLRLGAHELADNLTMLETGEPIYTPVTQEGLLLTEDLIRENEEFVLRTGSCAAGCTQLLSDMQAFKAANPGCILEDFVRWHSPPDWTEDESTSEANDCIVRGEGSSRGRLSTRMQKEGNLWRELWETAKPVPAVRQAPLFDEDLAVESIMTLLDDIPPSKLFEQLFLSLLGLGFAHAETTLSADDNMSKLFSECKDYVVATCQAESWTEKLDDICQVYESVETMLVRPGEIMKMIQQQPDEATLNADEPKRRFRRLRQIFGGKGSKGPRESTQKEDKTLDEKPGRQTFSNFFDSKSSMFSKKPKPPKPENTTNSEKSSGGIDDGEWTVV